MGTTKSTFKGCLIAFAVIFGVMILASLIITVMPEKNKVSESEPSEVKIDSVALAEKERADSIKLIEKEQALSSLKKFRKKSDEFSGEEFYMDKRTPIYINENFVYPYLVKKGSTVWLRLKFQYAADSWLFIQQVQIKTDNDTYTISARFEGDNDSGIWEWHDMPVNNSEYLMLKDISESKSVKMRYIGSQYRKDRNLTSKEKDIIKKTLEVYDKLK